MKFISFSFTFQPDIFRKKCVDEFLILFIISPNWSSREQIIPISDRRLSFEEYESSYTENPFGAHAIEEIVYQIFSIFKNRVTKIPKYFGPPTFKITAFHNSKPSGRPSTWLPLGGLLE